MERTPDITPAPGGLLTSDEVMRQLARERLVQLATPSGPVQAPPPPVTPNNDDEPLFSLDPLIRVVRITRDSLQRRKALAAATFVIALFLSGMALAAAPPDYQTTATILLAGDESLGGIAGSTDSATGQAASVILSEDNIDAMIVELQLAENEPEPPLLGRVRAGLFSSVFGTATTEDRRLALRDTLFASIFVANNEDSSITITVVWPDPDQAVAIAQWSYDRFLESRVEIEVEPLREAVQILSGRASRATAVVDGLREELDLSPDTGAAQGSELESAVTTQRSLVEDLRDAEIALDAGLAGVPLRYQLLSPPERPTRPIAGNLIGYAGALIGATVITLAVLYFLERPRGRVIRPWQLDDLDLSILATLSSPKRSSR